MKTEDVVRHFGGVARAAKTLGVSRQAIYKWGENVPELRQWQIQVLTDNLFKAEHRAA